MTTPDNTGAGGRKVAPFFTGKLRSSTVRFYLSVDEGFPWPCVDDIIGCAGKAKRSSQTVIPFPIKKGEA